MEENIQRLPPMGMHQIASYPTLATPIPIPPFPDSPNQQHTYISPPDIYSDQLQLLREQETLIYPQVLKYSASDSQDFRTRQAQFKETCFAIEVIIKQKLYKLTAQNLEQYFLKAFNVSRAQVYRLLDCASVLRVSFNSYFDLFLSLASGNRNRSAQITNALPPLLDYLDCSLTL